jgi:hypothetical protein
VVLCPWGDSFAYPEWMGGGGGRLPAPGEREAMVRSLADFVAHMRNERGLTNLRYVCLMNEPDNDPTRPVTAAEFVHLTRRLDAELRRRGVRDEVTLLTADESSSGSMESSLWLRSVLAEGMRRADAVSVHTYRQEYVPGLVPWLAARREEIDASAHGRGKPLLITEFGVMRPDAGTFDCPQNEEYGYGLFLADFGITAASNGASAALMWCLFDTYYTDELCQHWGLWRHGEEGWAPRPGFYAWSLVTRYTRAGSRVARVVGSPAASDVRAVAFRAPGGEVSVLLVNRYARDLRVTLDLGLSRAARVTRYVYSREAVATAGDAMLGASGELRSARGGTITLEVPAESFTVLTELE